MLQNRICREASCGRSFEGGPRAFYCPLCREERARKASADYQRRKRKGDIRPIGSIDKCARCNKPYTVNGGKQQYCPDCKPIHATEHDRIRALAYYRVNKDQINPSRNELRRYGITSCKWCGIEFPMRTGGPISCSNECRRQLINKWHREHYKNKGIRRCLSCKKRFTPKGTNAKYCSDRCRYRAHAEVKRKSRFISGKCPQCGGDWVEPETKRKKKPKHCKKCQEYYEKRRNKS